MENKSLYNVLNLKEIVMSVLRDYPLSDEQRIEASERVQERYSNLVREIAMKIIPAAAEKSAIMRAAQQLDKLK